MQLSGNIKDSTSGLNTPALPTSDLSLSGSGKIPTPHATESDPIFMAWDKTTGIEIEQEQVINTTGADIVPLALTCSTSGTSLGSASSQSGYATLTWTAIATTTLDHYQVRYKKSSLTYYNYINCNANTITIEGLLPGGEYNFGVASVNRYGTMSAFSSNITQTIAIDTTLPATVTGVAASAGVQYVILTWTSSSDTDLHSYNIYRNTTNSSAGSSLIANSLTNYFIDGGRTGGAIYYYWVKAKDFSGNLSASYSTVASATPTLVDTVNIADGAVTSVLTDLAAINPVNGEINANKVGTLQLDVNSVTEAKILNSAITAAKTSIASINPSTGEINANKVGTTQIVSDAVTEAQILNAAITSNKIATGAVIEGSIATGAITANKINAGAITADKIAAGAITATKITSYNFVVSEGTFTSHDPTATEFSWSGAVVVYNGTEYHITNSHCPSTDKHVYWELATPTVFATSASLPTLTNDDFLVAYNNTGDHLLVWNSTVINGNRITSGSITATNMAANSITANAIEADAITAVKIKAGEVTAVKMKTFNFLMSEGSFSNNSPGAGQLAWVGCKVVYDGTEYTITNSNCSSSNKHIYWQLASPTVFSASNGLPSLGNNDFLVAFNNGGTALYVWNSTVINGNRITTGSIAASCIVSNSITANQIAAGTITANEINSGTITADKLAAGAITATTVAATSGTIGGWNISDHAIYTGTEVVGDGYSAATTDMTIRDDGSIHAKNFYIDADGDVSFAAGGTSSINGVGFGLIDIGTWDMDTDANISVALPNFNQVRSVDVIIRTDNTLWTYALNTYAAGAVAGWWIIDKANGNIDLYRTAGGIFDQSAFSTTPSGGRGYITVQYEV